MPLPCPIDAENVTVKRLLEVARAMPHGELREWVGRFANQTAADVEAWRFANARDVTCDRGELGRGCGDRVVDVWVYAICLLSGWCFAMAVWR